MSNNPVLAYRPDIDGLRAIAVMAVVLYHFGFALPGGFVGVDVFFVISGYLITGIIQREIEQGRFTFAGFYERRIRRIFPALFAVLAATMLAAYFIMLPSDLVLLGKSTLATLLFGSNIFFWRTSGYFDSDSDLNPLLHTWSLAVEEQFYIGLPFLLLAVWRWKRQWLSLALVVSLIASFVLGLWVMQLRPTAAFYLSPFRAWELLAGGVLAIRRESIIWIPWLREVMAWLAISVLVASLFLVRSAPGFPGWQALAPVAATAFLIYIHSDGKTNVSKLLSIRPLVWIGLISYSLYLWHWPIQFFYKYLNAFDPLGYQAYYIAVLSLLIAAISYRYVETPFRDNKIFFDRKLIYIMALFSSLLVGMVGVIFWKYSGIPWRFSPEIQMLDAERNPHIPFRECDAKSVVGRWLNRSCVIGKASVTPSVIVWGDSHAMSIAPALSSIFEKKEISGIVVPNSACPGILKIEIINDSACRVHNDDVVKFIQENKNIKVVVLHSYWGFYTGKNSWRLLGRNGTIGLDYLSPSLDYTIQKLNRLGKKVIVIGQVATSPTTPTQIVLRRVFSKPPRAPFSHAEFQKINSDFSNAVSRVSPGRKFYYLDLGSYMCSSGTCSYMAGMKNMYRDTDHLSIAGSKYLEPFLEQSLPLSEISEEP